MRKLSLILAVAALVVVGGTFGITAATAQTAHAGTIKRGPHGPQGSTGVRGPAGGTGVIGPFGATGPAGVTGAAGPTGPTGPTGADGTSTGTGALNNFNAILTGSSTESVTVGSFTVRENAVAGACTGVTLVNNSAFGAEVGAFGTSAVAPGGAGGSPFFLLLGGGGSLPIAGSAGELDTFSVALVNGSSQMTGTVGDVSLTNNTCLTAGTISGV